MEISQVIFLIFCLVSFGFFGFTMLKFWNYFRLGQPIERFDQPGKRLLHTLQVAIGQTKIFRWAIPGSLHALVFWGFIVITFGTLEMIIDGIAGTERILSFLGPLYDFFALSGDLFAAIIIISCIIFLYRRYVIKPRRFTAPEMKPKSRIDATVILTLIMVLMFSLLGLNMAYTKMMGDHAEGIFPVSGPLGNFLFANTDPLTLLRIHEVSWWVHILIVLAFLNILPYSKHFHVILSIPNVFFKSLQPSGKLNNPGNVTKEVKIMMGMEEAPTTAGAPTRFGVKDIEDVSWKNIMDAYTCTECGRCTASCPANITGKKLSPRKLFIDLRKRMSEKGPELIKNKEYADNKTLFDFITPEELWACTSCGACMEECPVDIEHVPLIIDMRRYLVMEESKAPAALNNMFVNIENNGSPWAIPASSRMDWTINLQMKEL